MIAPSLIGKKADRALVIVWSDGIRSEYETRNLRLSCPCAVCVNEWTGEKILDPARVPENIRPLRVFSVGGYAMGVQWSDGHSSGIFAYDFLRRLAGV